MQPADRSSQGPSLHRRLNAEAQRLCKQAEAASTGHEREQFVRRARQAENAARINAWLATRNLQPV